MRLLNIHTLEFKTFLLEESRPPYVITSHRWADDEITFQHFLAHKSDPSVCQTAGFRKVKSFCHFVKGWRAGLDLDWIWIDTCCIDKTSSSELQEAINCMFRWYSDSYICLAYLKDVRSLEGSPAQVMNDFEQSVWFRRGWTLQELLAPRLVVFLTNKWEVIGHKASTIVQEPVEKAARVSRPLSALEIRFPLNQWISRAANIPEDIVADYKKSANLSIAQKRSWMANRSTTRPEDSAYCLLGICGIYLPLIYGEREQAFERLEEAIERRTQRKATQMPKIITSQSPNSTRATWGDRSEIDSNDDEDSGAINWHQIAKKHNRHGNKLLKSGQYAAAVQEYTHAIQTYPESPTFLMNRASAYMMTTRYGEAINDCNSALDLDPRNPEITELIAEAKNALGLPPGSTPLTLDSQEHRMNALDSENEHVSSKPTRAERPRVPRNSRYHTSPGEASKGSTREPQKPATKSSRKHERESMHRPGWGYHDILPQREPYSAPPQADGPRSSRYSGGFSDPNDIFAEFMRRGCSDDEDIFARYSQGEKDQKGNADPSPSPTVSKRVITEKPLPVSLEDILSGTTKKLKIRRKTYDPRIGKQGLENNFISVPIKPGLMSGTKFNYPKFGDDDVLGRPTDLHVITKDEPHAFFVRNGNDLEHTIELSPEEAESGYNRIVTTIDGKHLKVASFDRTHWDGTKRYSGQGLPISKTPEIRGDLIIKVKLPS